jgi:large subunit ribosomal protein L5
MAAEQDDKEKQEGKPEPKAAKSGGGKPEPKAAKSGGGKPGPKAAKSGGKPEPKAAKEEGKPQPKEPRKREELPESRLRKRYREEVVPGMMKKFGYTNVMQVPRLTKIVLNMGIGDASRDIKMLDAAEREMGLIAGQKAVPTRASRAISAFKIRAGMPVGCFVTLRGRRMYDFLDRLINVAIPRVRDFRGLPAKSFDGRGNHSMGIREHLIFMELDYNKVSTVRGMNITTVTTAKTDEEARELLRLFGLPFRES